MNLHSSNLKIRKNSTKTYVLLSSVFFSFSANLYATDSLNLENYLDISMETMLSMDVVSLFKEEQKVQDSASAVYVINQNDIKRSGASSIPDLLRMVPGLNVARISASKWAISSRGFNRLWSNKLLVMQDGRTLYDPLFSGVYWDMQDVILENIDRIEIIRGPGASLWGSNAVNGVINIITKKVSANEGHQLVIEAGNFDQKRSSLSLSSKINDQANIRVYAKDNRRSESQAISETGTEIDAHDAYLSQHAGFRLDWEIDKSNSLILMGDVKQARFDRISTSRTLFPVVTSEQIEDQEDVDAANILMRWESQQSSTNKISFQMYYDYADRGFETVKDKRDIFDLEFQQSLSVNSQHEIIWGLNYRYYNDKTDENNLVLFTPLNRKDNLYGLFVQDKWLLNEYDLSVITGLRFENNEYSGNEWQPNLRVSWSPTSTDTLWAAASRAIHSPSRIEHNGTIVSAHPSTVPGQPDMVFTINGNEEVESETVIAYELGYRTSIKDVLFIDSSLFYNQYDDLLGGVSSDPQCQSYGFNPCHYLEFPITFASNMEGQTYGLELSAEYLLSDSLKLKGSYTYLNMSLKSDIGFAMDEAKQDMVPSNQFSLRAMYDINEDLEVDLFLRYSDELPL
ncbi:MAG: TonB-dependent receptor, partial [Gammaproteobacteria bacterium]|nr:TonB-dependent receptor [Gammaproteobacteria bacterium]